MLIRVQNLVKRYKDVLALDHLNLEVHEGEILGLLGPNGSGKTTAINCILALLTYDKGSIEVFGKPMTPHSYESKRNIGIVLQNVAVFDELTVYENVDYFCGLYVADRALRAEYVASAIEFVGLQDYARRLPPKLSGGLRRRLNIACGIAHRPKLLILDEPTVAVDPQSRNAILEGLRRLNELGTAIVYTSHYMEEVEQLCSRIIIIDHGRTIAGGTTAELKAMINVGEAISVELLELSPAQLDGIRHLPRVNSAEYNQNMLQVRYSGGSHNLIDLLDHLRDKGLSYGRVYAEQPTLNDVFLEITGRQLRDPEVV